MSSDLIQVSRWRLRWATWLITAIAVLLVVQLSRWTVWPRMTAADESDRTWMPNAAGASAFRSVTRGNVLDRNGSLLVTTGYRWEVSVSANLVTSKAVPDMANALAPLVGWSPQDLAEELNGNSQSVMLGRVDYATGLQIRDLNVSAIRLIPLPMRVYPEGALAAHVLGFVNLEQQAYYGVEQAWADYLRGAMVLDWVGQGKSLSLLGPRFEQNASPDGANDLILTIDRAIQYRTEQALRLAIAQTGAEAGSIIVMEPGTGAILASASYPAYAPGEYTEYQDTSWVDPAVSSAYEPGSIFKIITMAAGLNSGAIRPGDTYVDTGCIEVGDEQICNLNRTSYGLSSMQDVLVYSLNLGTSYISDLLGPENYYPYVERFGFGQLTDVDLAGEIRGSVRWPDSREWHELDLVTNSYGQGLAVTPIQMITAIAAVANRGYLMKPHVVKGMIGHGRVIGIEPHQVRQVIYEETAQVLTDMLVQAVDDGLPAAKVPGYSVAGKSGTAEIPSDEGYEGGTIAGFVGYLPASNPALVILVKIVRPQGETLGSKVAGPVFSSLAEQLVTMMGIPPDRSTTM